MTAAQASDDPAKQYEGRLGWANGIGSLLIDRQLALAMAVKAVGSHTNLNEDSRVQGWLVDASDEGGYTVYFVGLDAAGVLRVAHTATIAEDRSIIVFNAIGEGSEASDKLKLMWKARKLSFKHMPMNCANRYWSDVIPATEEDDEGRRTIFAVYNIPAPKNRNLVPLGGAVRFFSNEDATGFERIYPFTKSCLVLDRTPSEGREVAGLIASHINAPHPEEIHVYHSLLQRLPFYIITVANEVTWKVDGAKISVVKENAKTALGIGGEPSAMAASNQGALIGTREVDPVAPEDVTWMWWPEGD